jgi:hypothetical protein
VRSVQQGHRPPAAQRPHVSSVRRVCSSNPFCCTACFIARTCVSTFETLGKGTSFPPFRQVISRIRRVSLGASTATALATTTRRTSQRRFASDVLPTRSGIHSEAPRERTEPRACASQARPHLSPPQLCISCAATRHRLVAVSRTRMVSPPFGLAMGQGNFRRPIVTSKEHLLVCLLCV